MFLNVLVAVDGSPSSRRAIEQAVDLARAQNSKVTLITVAPPVSSFVALGRMSPDLLQRELEDWAEGVLTDAAASIPDDVIAHGVHKSGHVGEQIVRELERGSYDLIVLGTRGRGPAREGLFGSVNGYVHFHARVPVLSVPYNE